MIEDLTREDVADILHGATLFGGGGGGDLKEGFDLIDEALRVGKGFRMVSLCDLPDDAVLCTPYLLGAVSDLPERDPAARHPLLHAFETLEADQGHRIHGTIACELGGSNTAVPFFVAAMKDAVVVDADPAGRAVPEITHSTYALAGLPPDPIYLANARGERMILDNIADDQRAEDIVRALAQASSNDIAAIDHVMPAGALRRALISGTLSKARRLGQLLRAGRSDPPALPPKIAQAAGGAVVFEGRVIKSTHRTEGGFTLGRFSVAGDGAFTGQTCAVDLKNENMVAWVDDTAVATIPDIITVLNRTTGEVTTNPHVQPDDHVAILVLPAPDAFLSPAGLAAFGPGYAGLDMDFWSVCGSRS